MQVGTYTTGSLCHLTWLFSPWEPTHRTGHAGCPRAETQVSSLPAKLTDGGSGLGRCLLRRSNQETTFGLNAKHCDLVHNEQQPPVNNGNLQTTKSKMSLECGKPFNHESTLGVR